jgi:hypothetical protein
VAPTNPNKRWTKDDFEIPSTLARGRDSVRVTLTPRTAALESLFKVVALSRRR